MITHMMILTMLTQLSTIEGQVRDARTHAPMACAAVELLRERIPVDRALADRDGRFRFTNLIPDTYAVLVDCFGFETSVVAADLLRGVDTHIAIDLSAVFKPSLTGPLVVSARDFMVPKNARKEFDRARKELKRQD